MGNTDVRDADNEYFRLFFSLSVDLFCISRLDGTFEHFNPAWEKTLGYSFDELASRVFIELVHPDDIAKTLSSTEKSNREGVLEDFENRILCKDGSYRTILWNCQKHSKKPLMFSVGRDITEQKKFASELENKTLQAELQTENLFMLLSQVPAIAAAVKGPDHIFQFANNAFCGLLGNRSPVGLPMVEVFPHLKESTLPIMNRVFETGEQYKADQAPMTSDWQNNGTLTTRYFTFIYSALRNSQRNVEGIWCLAFDVTEIKQMEERLKVSERMASLGTVAAGVAHEINNPLAYVKSSLDLLTEQLEKIQATSPFQEAKTLLDRAKNCDEGLERINRIVRSLKTFSRTNDETFGPIDVCQVIQTTMKFAENELKYRSRVKFDMQSVPKVFGNEGKLSQVFLNLIVNAAQAIPPGQVQNNLVTIRVYTSPAGCIEITISDTGCGIAPENIARIFDPFYTSKPVGEGTGLGLSICQGIITSMKGELFVESAVGKGTTFKLTLPACATEEMPTVPASSIEAITPLNKVTTSQPKRVLVIDDEVAFAEIISLSLSEEFDVTVVNSVYQALLELDKKSDAFDIILCDMMMPEKTGMDLYHELQCLQMGFEERIIFMTGGVFTSEAQSFLTKTAVQKISKPFSMKSLRSLITTTFHNLGQSRTNRIA